MGYKGDTVLLIYLYKKDIPGIAKATLLSLGYGMILVLYNMHDAHV